MEPSSRHVARRTGPTERTRRAFGIDGVASADATRRRNGSWQVPLTSTDDGVAAVDRAARICFERRPPCVTGQLALVIDETVATGGEAEARTLAETSTG